MTSILLTLLISYILLFLFSLKIKDNSIVDVFWGFGFVLIAVISYLQSDMWLPQTVVTTLICLWGARIVSHIGLRKLKERREDARYAKWREEWGSGWYFVVRSFLQVYMLQMILMLVVATAILVVNMPSGNMWYVLTDTYRSSGCYEYDLAPVVCQDFFGYLKYNFLFFGLVIWWSLIALAGLIFETIADRQLAEFVRTKKPGEIFTSWLYRYSRHPNYFGESVFWLGISLIALPYSYWGLVSFFVITILLLFVSGVPLQEARYAGRANWEEYKKKTSVFVPWFPKQ
jgi:steroid 5-alpha reductase family enzyme